MTKRIRVSELPEFDAAKYLNSEEDVAAYLTDILEGQNLALLAAALDDIARARGASPKLSDIAVDDLADVLDTVIWDTNPAEPLPVTQWLAELQAHPNVDTPEIQRAIEVCKDYLAD